MENKALKRPSELTSKLKTSDPEIINHVLGLEKENLKLQRQIAKLQVKNISLQNQIAALKKAQPKHIVQVVNFAEIDDKTTK